MSETRVLLTRERVARRLGVKIKSIDKMRERSIKRGYEVPFPEPAQVFERTPVWDQDEVDVFASATGRRVVDDDQKL